MKKILLLFYFLLFSCCIVEAQNLVPNPSFEVYDTCPNHGGNIEEAIGWILCGFSPDYYNACANSSFASLGVPSGGYSGYQNAFDGNAFGALLTLSIPNTGREFIGTQLTEPLIVGTKYYVSAYIVAGIYECSANNFGFKFFNNMSYSFWNAPPIDNFSHVHSNVIISDSVNWTQVRGSFIADSAYQYLVIGNFYSNSNTDTIHCRTNGDGTYYLIDAVCVSTDSLTCYQAIGINEIPIPTSEIKIFPNPAHSTFTLNSPLPAIRSQLKIYNCLGEIVHQQIITSANQQINLEVVAGVYYIRVGRFTKKLIVY
jgi:hypothetical protein